MKIKLRSDFDDYYDSYFDREGITFDRLSECGPYRREMYALLERAGYRVPRHGSVEAMSTCIGYERRQVRLPVDNSPARHKTDLVVYATERGHGGDNHLVSVAEALSIFPGHYCTEYIPVQSGRGGWSLQYLQIGDRHWWLSYASRDNWRSNVGDCKVEVIEEGQRGFHDFFTEPVFSIDFVPAQELYAIDFNITPRLVGTSIDNVLSPIEVIALIRDAMLRRAR